MKEKNLILFSLFIACFGIILLFIISSKIQINDTTIQKINNEQIEGTVTVQGVVKKVSSSEKFSKITIINENELDAIAYDNLDLNVNDHVKITGKYQDNVLVIDTIKQV